jgi:hypothetical protein
MPRLLFASALLLCLFVAGCAGCTEGGVFCETDGQRLEVGESYTTADECNECVCEDNGELSCTEKACENGGGENGGGSGADGGGNGGGGGPDAGVPDSGPPDAGGPPTDCVDLDHDGFYTCLDENYPNWPQVVDCDDSRYGVQPGGYEFPGNLIDDDCDDEIDERTECGCALSESANAPDFLASIGLCDDAITASTQVGDPEQFGVFTDYYSDVEPRDGNCLGVMSSGFAYPGDISDVDVEFGGEDFNDSVFTDPDPNVTGIADTVHNLAQVQITFAPPSNARGFAFDFMFMSAEWPEFLCQNFNDTFYALFEGDEVQGGMESNISFDAEGREITVNTGFFEEPRRWTTTLNNTPFGLPDTYANCTSFPDDECFLPDYCDNDEADLAYKGSGSGWLTTYAPLADGEEAVTLVFSIHDEGDAIYDSVVLIDR